MLEAEIEVQNRLGLHARPAALFVQTASRFQSNIRVIKEGQEVDGKSIMGLMVLAAEFGSRLRIVIEGEDESNALQSLKELFERKFDED